MVWRCGENGEGHDCLEGICRGVCWQSRDGLMPWRTAWREGVWKSGKQVKWCMIGVNGGGLWEEMHGALLWGWTLDFEKTPQLWVATAIWSPGRVEIHQWPSSQLKDTKGKCSCFISFSFTNLLFSLISWHGACRPRGGGNWLKYNKYKYK